MTRRFHLVAAFSFLISTVLSSRRPPVTDTLQGMSPVQATPTVARSSAGLFICPANEKKFQKYSTILDNLFQLKY
jgi:hypothetical protein